MFEMFTWELHATFLRNHNTRAHRTPSRGHLNTGDPQAPEVPASPAATTARSTGHCTRSGALHPIGGTTPDMGHCTRSGALHPIWGAAPEQKRCIAYGSGAAPQHTRTNAELANRTTPPPQPARAATRPRPLHALLGTASGSMGAAPAATYRANMRMKGRTRPPTGNDAPVSAGNAPSPRPRWLQYRSASPVRRYGHPQCRRLGPCR